MTAQHFFVEGRYLGSREINPWFRVPGLEVRPHHSFVLYCGRCGELWGRLLIDGAPYTQCVHRNCARHGDGRLSCPPSWSDDPTRFESDWPSAAIRYEFERTLDHVKKEGIW